MIHKNNNESTIASTNPVVDKNALSRIEQFLSLLPFFKNSNPVISVLRLEGVIGKVGAFKTGLSIDGLNELIEIAFNKPKVKAVCLVINSPGGSPVQSELIASRIISLSKAKNIPVYSFVEDVAASGGYWLAAAGSEIYASKSSIVGSFGVISAGFGFEGAIEKLGITRRIYTAGKNKSVLDPFLPPKKEDISILKNLQKQVCDHFIDYIKTRRGGKLTQSDEILFTGEFWAGQSALDYGLIDGIDNLYNFVKQRFGEEVKIDYVTPKKSWFKKKMGLNATELSQEITDSAINSVENKSLYNKFQIK